MDGIPQDSYSLALYALDRSFNPRPRGLPHLDFNLKSSPYTTSKDKHHAIYRTARGIMRRLDQVVHEVRVSDSAGYSVGTTGGLRVTVDWTSVWLCSTVWGSRC